MIESHYEYDPLTKGVRVWLFTRAADVVRVHYPGDARYVELGPNEILPDEPSFALSTEEAQALAACLTGAGIRPPEAEIALRATEGRLEAAGAHLEDMRRLVFGGGVRAQERPDDDHELATLRRSILRSLKSLQRQWRLSDEADALSSADAGVRITYGELKEALS